MATGQTNPYRARRSATPCRWLFLALLLVLCGALTGCASITLDVVQDGRLIGDDEASGVEIVRQGTRLRSTANMPLQPGDEIRTDGRSSAVVSYVDGARVYVQPGSQVRLGSLFVAIGEVLIKVRGYFQVDTRYATAASEGTAYLVRVAPGDRVRVVVAEDSVGLTARPPHWPKSRLAVGQAATLVGPDLIEIALAAPGEVADIRRRIADLDQLVPNRPGIGTALLVGGVLTSVGIAIGSHRHKDRPERGEQPVPAGVPSGDAAGTVPPLRRR